MDLQAAAFEPSNSR